MIRKSMLALVAVATVTAAALTPTSASAWGFKHHHHHFGFWGWGPRIVVGGDCYLVKRYNRFGELRFYRVCD